MSSDAWGEYLQDARRLDEVRAEESARTAGMREGVAQMSAHADELEARLLGQSQSIATLAATLRFRRQNMAPIPPDPEQRLEPAPALGDLAARMDEADREAREAGRRGLFPALLPSVRGRARALLVYGIAALGVLALQALAFSRSGTETSPVTVLFLVPLAGFVLGYVVLRLGSRTRVSQSPPDLAPRLGFVVCFLIGPAGAAASVVNTMLSR